LVPSYRPRFNGLKFKAIMLIRVLLGLTFVTKLLERHESEVVRRYREVLKRVEGDFRRSMEEAIEALGSEEVVVETCSEDLKAVKSIASELSKERNVKIKVSGKTIDVIGGVKVSRADGTMVYDATIDYRLGRLSDQLRTVVVKHLVSEDR
jgi:V/A-type H+-transporting ATPase subunit E